MDSIITNVMDVIVKCSYIYVSCAFIKDEIRIILMSTDDTFVLALKCATNKFHLYYDVLTLFHTYIYNRWNMK